MTTQQEALRKIVALREQHWIGDWEYLDKVKAIIADVSPDSGGVLDHEALRLCIGHALYQGQGEGKPTVDDVMGWIEKEAVRSSFVFDREKARNILRGHVRSWGMLDSLIDRLAECVRPVALDNDSDQLRIVASHLDTGGKYQATAELMRRVADQLEAAP